MKTAQDFINDIPERTAVEAHGGTSFTPERRGESERAGYAAHMAAFYSEIVTLAGEDRREEAEAEFERYRQRYLRLKLGALGSRSRIVSWMVAGPSNFPTRRMEKLNAAYDRRIKEWLEWDERIKNRIRRRFGNKLSIRTGEASAVDDLAAKLATQQAAHAYMVGVNKLLRKNKLTIEQRIGEARQLAERLGVNADQFKSFYKSNFDGMESFPSFALTNSNARIKATQAALKKAKKLASETTTERVVGDVRIVNNVEDDRLQVFFPERVPHHIYKMLSGHGFRHSRRNGCFQAFRGNNANYWLGEILKVYAKEQP